MSEQKLSISIPTCSQKLRQNFPDDPKGDIQIQIKQKVYKLSKAHLRLQSNYFKKILTVDRSILQIQQNFNQQSFNNILECFYGATLQIKRKDVLVYFPIVQFLQIQCLINKLRQDMIQHTSQYGLFKLFDIAYHYADQKLFQKCLLELQFHNFAQMKTEKDDVMKISKQLFKLIIKTHNKLPRQKRAFNVYEIKNLITEYSEINKMSNSDKNNLKFQLIDKNHLNSFEYRDIFLNDGGNHHGTDPGQFKKFQTRALSLNTMKNQKSMDMFFTTHSMTVLTHKKLYLQMDTTFQRKISHQLSLQKKELCNQLINLNTFSINQNKKSRNLKQQFEQLRKKISQKSQQNFYSDKIKSIDSSLSQLSKSLSSQSQRLSTLMKNTQQLIQKYDENEKLDISQDSCSSSLLNLNEKNQKINQFIHVKNQIKSNQKLTPPNNKSNTNKSNSIVSKSQYQIKQDIKYTDKDKDKDRYRQKSQANISVSSFTGEVNKRDRIQIQINGQDNKSIKQKSKQKNQDKDQKNKQNKPLNYKQIRLQFDRQSNIIKTQRQLQSLCSIITVQRFIQKRLKFIYRAQKPTKPKTPTTKQKSNFQICKQIRQKLQQSQNIIILIRTKQDKLIGGYYSIKLSLLKQKQYFDKNAYIFSVTQCRKYPVKQPEQAIMINKGYILCFSVDLMISQAIFQTQNYCGWPDHYQNDKNPKEKELDRGSEWFAGQSQFQIKQIQIWKVEQNGSDMVI